MKSLTIFLICVTGFLAVGLGAEADAEAALLKGKWQIIDERLDKLGIVIVWEFTATEIIVRDEKTGEEYSRPRYTIDATKSPQWITVEADDSPTGDSGDRRLGIFRIQDGELHLKQEITDRGKRPAKFEAQFARFKRVPENHQAEHDGGLKGLQP